MLFRSAIPPTPTIATVGILDDLTHHVTQWFKTPGDVIVLLGETKEELGASEYLASIHGLTAGAPPALDLEREKRLQSLCLTAARERLLSSAHDVTEGGLAIAVAEACISRPEQPIGASVTLASSLRPDALLFGESQSRVLVSLPRTALPRLRALADKEAGEGGEASPGEIARDWNFQRGSKPGGCLSRNRRRGLVENESHPEAHRASEITSELASPPMHRLSRGWVIPGFVHALESCSGPAAGAIGHTELSIRPVSTHTGGNPPDRSY